MKTSWTYFTFLVCSSGRCEKIKIARGQKHHFIFLLQHTENNKKSKLLEILNNDRHLKKWYNNFLVEVKNYHKTQYFAIRKFKIN